MSEAAEGIDLSGAARLERFSDLLERSGFTPAQAWSASASPATDSTPASAPAADTTPPARAERSDKPDIFASQDGHLVIADPTRLSGDEVLTHTSRAEIETAGRTPAEIKADIANAMPGASSKEVNAMYAEFVQDRQENEYRQAHPVHFQEGLPNPNIAVAGQQPYNADAVLQQKLIVHDVLTTDSNQKKLIECLDDCDLKEYRSVLNGHQQEIKHIPNHESGELMASFQRGDMPSQSSGRGA